MFFTRAFTPTLLATTCCQSFSRLAAFTTIMTLSSKRYTMQSSMKVPLSLRSAEYCACPSSSAPTSLQVRRFTQALRSGPVNSNSPMCDTSNTPTPLRTARCSLVMPDGYCTGISKPANGTILAPSSTCIS